ncbi:MAG: 5-formyltetrahydrofolate cyclo-ligase [Sphingomonadales bacterium]|nr:5-formyltetrahydrofolate cyclo-ligase [Sphingomonadales bacterium]MDE2169082.1 5-formyltetrahydrofolate cyclo-ligase [Sphingomonadales bacterium]
MRIALDEKKALRASLRKARRAHVAALNERIKALILLRPPAIVAALAAPGSTVGLYHALPEEAPTRGYAAWFGENGYKVALPWFADADAPMQFRLWANPHDDGELEPGPFGARQPHGDAAEALPQTVFVPLVGFTQDGHRLGQGGGHYDRWLALHPDVTALGLGWDCQLVEELPLEEHDHPLHAVITPTRLYGAL